MDIAVELFFNPESEKLVRDIWHKLAQAGVNSAMEDLGSTPHISLAVYDDVEIAALQKKVADFAGSFSPIPLRLSAVGVFPGEEGVMFLAPAPTEGLLKMQTLYHNLTEEWSHLVWPYYRLGGVWFPHCTLAMGLKDPEMPQALSVARAGFTGIDIIVESVGVVQYSPAQVIAKFPF